MHWGGGEEEVGDGKAGRWGRVQIARWARELMRGNGEDETEWNQTTKTKNSISHHPEPS